MHRVARLAALVLVVIGAAGVARADDWTDHAPLPFRIANNAVAVHEHDGTTYIYTFMGIDETRIWSGIQRTAARLNLTTGLWEALPDVPGTVGRIAALAYGFGDKVYLFGGYSVSAGGAEVSFAAVDIYSPKLAEIQCLAVQLEFQQLGVGKQLVARCVELARHNNVRELMVITSSDEFLQECGFDYSLPRQKRALFINP